MAKVIVTLKIMPESPETDLESTEKQIMDQITKAYGDIETKTETENIAFGLKALLITFVIDESSGTTDELENKISEIPGINSVEAIDVRRAIG